MAHRREANAAAEKAVELASNIIHYYDPHALDNDSTESTPQLHVLIDQLRHIRHQVQLEKGSLFYSSYSLPHSLIDKHESSQGVVGNTDMQRQAVIHKATAYLEVWNDYLMMLEKDIQPYFEADVQDTHSFALYFLAVIRNVYYKLRQVHYDDMNIRCIRLSLLTRIYCDNTMTLSAKTISDRIASVIQTLQHQLTSLSASLSQYDQVGVEFHSIVNMFSRVCSDIEQLKSHLNMMQS